MCMMEEFYKLAVSATSNGHDFSFSQSAYPGCSQLKDVFTLALGINA